MKNFFKNVWSKIGLMALGVMGFLGLAANHAKAAADTDLTSALASTTAIFTDNKSIIVLFLVGVFAVAIVIVLLRKALGFGKAQVAGAMGGGRKGGRR